VRLKAKRDDSEKAIVERLEHLGAQVCRLSGKDIPDLLVLHRGTLHLVEAKTGKARLKPGQATFAAVWPVTILRDAEEATEWLLGLGAHAVRHAAAKSNYKPITWDEV
jgi:hypothetical protein